MEEPDIIRVSRSLKLGAVARKLKTRSQSSGTDFGKFNFGYLMFEEEQLGIITLMPWSGSARHRLVSNIRIPSLSLDK